MANEELQNNQGGEKNSAAGESSGDSKKRRRGGRRRRKPRGRNPQPDNAQQQKPEQEKNKNGNVKGNENRNNNKTGDRVAKENNDADNQRSQHRANMVVLVDDDPAYVEMESLAVAHYMAGFNPMGFSDASKALNYITNPRNTNRVGLVLLDLEMPKVDGHTVQEILQVLKRSRDIPVAIVSAHNNEENITRVQELGAVGFLPKAFTMEVFVWFVKEVIRSGKVNGWKCNGCGKLVQVSHVDIFNMCPIKCIHGDCESTEFSEIEFGKKYPDNA